MAKLILKCRYLKQSSSRHSENLINYIAKRDGVEKIDDTWRLLPATKSQEKLIRQLIKDFPDTANSFEYQDYIKNPSKGSASEFITHAIDANVDLIDNRENYIGYIAKRPRVERMGSHGLFTDSNIPITLSKVAEEVANHDGNVWTNIISLRREDATRLGYDNAAAWRELIRSKTKDIAESMKIPLEDLRWYAAYHDESYHPHVHLVAYSAGKEPYLSKKGIDNMRSAFARDIFRHDLLEVYTEQTKHRDTLKTESREILADIIRQINSGGYDNPIVEDLLVKLSKRLADYKGKKVYGYLPQTDRNIVNSIVDELEKDSRIDELYSLWQDQKNAVLSTYKDTFPESIPLSQNKEFKSIKNAVIQEAVNILYDRITFEDALQEDNAAPEPSDDFTEPIAPAQPSGETKWWNDETHHLYQYRKAKEYLNKDDPDYDPQEAVRWLIKSASQGYEYAQYRLGKMFLHGDEIGKDVDYALGWLWKAEKQNNPFAEYLLGKTFLKGEDIEQNLSQAEELFEKASSHDSRYAKYSLAKMHLDGLAASINLNYAISLLRESADMGYQWSQYMLGKFAMRGELIPKNPVEAERLLLAAALSEKRITQKNIKTSQGTGGLAQYALGKLYLSDDGIPKDVEKAVHFLTESANQENQYAQYQLGKMYLYGQGVPEDYAPAVKLLTASAEQGNEYAAKVLKSYHSGKRISNTFASMRLLARLSQMFRDNIRRDAEGQKMLRERKLMKQIEEKKQAHGLKMG